MCCYYLLFFLRLDYLMEISQHRKFKVWKLARLKQEALDAPVCKLSLGSMETVVNKLGWKIKKKKGKRNSFESQGNPHSVC